MACWTRSEPGSPHMSASTADASSTLLNDSPHCLRLCFVALVLSPSLSDQLVDDGLATGSTMRAAVRALRKMNPRAIVVAVPVGARETCQSLANEVEEMICLRTPQPFDAVGMWYGDFSQTSDSEVHDLLRKSHG